MSRYDKNVTSVRNICKILGYRLVGYNPDWSIAVVEEKLPNSKLEIMAHQMRGQYDQISDELMGRLALLMGFDWIFEVNDDDIRKLIEKTEYNEKIQFFEAKLRQREKLRRFLDNKREGPIA